MKKKKLKKPILIITVFILVLLVILIFYFKNKFSDKNRIIGAWTTDNVTTYEFRKDGTGYLIVPLSRYKFAYLIKDKKISIDFENETSQDSTYKYSFKNGKLILEGDYGKFTFKKKNK